MAGAGATRGNGSVTRLAGVDGCRVGWVVATAGAALDGVSFSVVADLSKLMCEADGDGLIVAIDMPIGLAASGARGCDVEARALLGFPRKSSVFTPCCRAALAAQTYRDACRLNMAACGRMLSQQSYHLLPKMRELDGLITPARQRYVREAHPELVFAALAGTGSGLAHAKRTRAGEEERLALLGSLLPGFDAAAIGAVRARLGAAAIAYDDIVDAAACLSAAHRLLRGTAWLLPAGREERDERGLRMEIIA